MHYLGLMFLPITFVFCSMKHVWAQLYHSPPVYFRAYPTSDLAETLGCEFSTLNLRFEGGRLGSN